MAGGDPVLLPPGTPYERARAALTAADRRPRLVVLVPDDVLFRGTGLDPYEEAVRERDRGGGEEGGARGKDGGTRVSCNADPPTHPTPPHRPFFRRQTQIIAALHAADVALALIAITDAPASALDDALARAGVRHAFRATRRLPPRLAPHSPAAADALLTALRDVRDATGLASFVDAVFVDDGSACAAGLGALGLTMHQVSGGEGLAAADLEAVLASFAANVDAARGF